MPGGLGGIDGGLIGTLIVFGAPAATAAAAVLAYRVILFWLPLLVGAVAFISLRRGLNGPTAPTSARCPPRLGGERGPASGIVMWVAAAARPLSPLRG